MMTTPSIEFDVPISVGEGGPVLVPAAAVSPSQVPVPPLQCARGEDASETVRLFQTALERPLAENAVLQQTLEEVVRQLSNRPIPDVRPEGIGTRPAVAPTVVVVQTPDVVVQSPVEAVARGVEVVPVVPVATPEVAVARPVAEPPVSVVQPPVETVDRGVEVVPVVPVATPEVVVERPAVVPTVAIVPPAVETVDRGVEVVPVVPVATPEMVVARPAAAPTVAIVPPAVETVGRGVEDVPVVPVATPEVVVARPAVVPTVAIVPPAVETVDRGVEVVPVVPVATPEVVVERPAVAPTVAIVPPAVETVGRGVEDVPVVPVATPEVVVERPAAALTERQDLSGATAGRMQEAAVPAFEVLGDGPVAPSVRGEDEKTVEALDGVDSVVASGVRPSEVAIPSVPVVEVDTGKQAVSAVDSVKAAWSPVDVPKTETFLAAANAVADVLLVTPGLLRGEGEIRVHLRPDVLEGSDVRISVVGRQLGIEFIPQTADVAVLIERNRPQLEQHLATRFQAFQLSVGVRRERSREVKGRTV